MDGPLCLSHDGGPTFVLHAIGQTLNMNPTTQHDGLKNVNSVRHGHRKLTEFIVVDKYINLCLLCRPDTTGCPGNIVAS